MNKLATDWTQSKTGSTLSELLGLVQGSIFWPVNKNAKRAEKKLYLLAHISGWGSKTNLKLTGNPACSYDLIRIATGTEV